MLLDLSGASEIPSYTLGTPSVHRKELSGVYKAQSYRSVVVNLIQRTSRAGPCRLGRRFMEKRLLLPVTAG